MNRSMKHEIGAHKTENLDNGLTVTLSLTPPPPPYAVTEQSLEHENKTLVSYLKINKTHKPLKCSLSF